MKSKQMTKPGRAFSLIIAFVLIYACKPAPHKVEVRVTNPADIAIECVIALDGPVLNDLINKDIRVESKDQVLPYQKVDADNDGKTDQLLVLCKVDKNSTIQLVIKEGPDGETGFEKRTQAELSVKEGGRWEKVTKNNGTGQYEYQGGEFKNITHLRVPEEHTDHSFFIRYEGPGWESDKVGYRFYLDWRNATDIFGKKVPEMVLQDVGQDGFESYHELSGWGMDVLKVGSSLGIGSIGFWDGEKAVRVENTDSVECTITQNGILRSSIETKYYGWKDPGTSTNLTSQFSIDAGSRLTYVELSASKPVENICTGIVKHEETEVIRKKTGDNTWGCLATYGRQSLNNDNLGMAVFYRQADLIEQTEDEHNHVLVLSSGENDVDYYFGAVWEPDVDQIGTREGFVEYLDATLTRLNTPLKINY